MCCNSRISVFVFAMLQSFFTFTSMGQDQVPAGAAAVLKHPVMVVSGQNGAKPGQIPVFIEKFEVWKSLKSDESVLAVDELATALDMVKGKLSGSNVLRVTEMPAAWFKEDVAKVKADPALPDYLLVAVFGTGSEGRKVFLRLVEPCTGNVLSTAAAVAGKFEDSIPTALKKIEDDVALFAWRCRVIETVGAKNIINRGRLDGVRNGDEFQGYRIDSQGRQNETMPEELLLMKSGVKTGKYKVVEEGRQFSKVEPVGDAPLLSAGDFLEQPDIWLRDRKRESRGRRTWDKIYDKQ